MDELDAAGDAVTAEVGGRPAPAAAEALVADVFSDASILKGGTVALASGALARAALVALDIGGGAADPRELDRSLRKASIATAAALVAEERRHLHDPPNQIVRRLHKYVTRRLAEQTELFDDLDELAMFLFEKGARFDGLRKAKRDKLISELAWTLAGCCRGAGMAERDHAESANTSPDTAEAVAQARELLAEDVAAHADALEAAAKAVRAGRAFELEDVTPALKWSTRLSELCRVLNGDQDDEVSTASLQARVRDHERNTDPRRDWLEQLKGVTSTARPQPGGLEDVRRRASVALEALANDSASEPELDALHAVHQIISGGAPAELVLSELLPRAIGAGLSPALLVAPTLGTLQLPAQATATHADGSAEPSAGTAGETGGAADTTTTVATPNREHREGELIVAVEQLDDRAPGQRVPPETAPSEAKLAADETADHEGSSEASNVELDAPARDESDAQAEEATTPTVSRATGPATAIGPETPTEADPDNDPARGSADLGQAGATSDPLASREGSEPPRGPATAATAGKTAATAEGDATTDESALTENQLATDPLPGTDPKPVPDDGVSVEGADDGDRLAEIIANAALAGHWSIAYWLCVSGNQQTLSRDALRAAALAAVADNQLPEVVHDLEVTLQRTISTSATTASELVAAGAAMKLLSCRPYGLATSVLREAARKLEHASRVVAETCAMLADRSLSGAFTELVDSEGARAAASLSRRRSEIMQRADVARENWPRELHSYPPANRIWTRFSSGSGDLARVLSLIADGSEDLAVIDEKLTPFAAPKTLDRMIDDAYGEIRRVSRGRLEAKARRWIYDRVDRVIALAAEWSDTVLAERAMRRAGGEDVASLRDAIRRSATDVDHALRELEPQSAPFAIAAAVIRDGWSAFEAVVEGRETTPPMRISSDEALNGELSLVLGLQLDDALVPVRSRWESLRPLLEEPELPELREAYEHRVLEGDHRSSGYLLRRLEAADGADERRREAREADIHTRRERLRGRIDQARIRLSRLLGCAALSADLYERFAAEFDGVEVEEVLAFPAVTGRLDELDTQLDERSEAHRHRLEERLREARPADRDLERISGLLADEQFDVADELVGRLERGEALIDPQPPDHLAMFHSLLEGIDDPGAFEHRIMSRAAATAGVTEDELKEVRAAIQALGTLRSPRLQSSVLVQRLQMIFSTLGLDVVGSVKEQRGRPQYGEIFCEGRPIGAQWVPPAFGSLAAIGAGENSNSQYTIIICRGQVREQELVAEVGQRARRNTAVLVLAVDPLTLQRRRTLARAARKEQVTFLLADAFTLLYQAVGRRLGAGSAAFDVWLATGLPYAWINPYVTRGNVPREMFFGRREEQLLLNQPGGSCFVFGGRQLGKSALLATVRDLSMSPDGRQQGFLVDLKREGIGHWNEPDRLWTALHNRLCEVGIATADDPVDLEAVVRVMREWLDADRGRQIRLLLDEADGFLEREAELGFPNLLALRGLMEETAQRFKVVLAGLHSVNRFRQIPNQPLAQFGGTSPVGPLTWADARDLVDVPMRAAGFRFDPPDLVHRILVESRRHPSLLQFVCSHLIDHFSGAGASRNPTIPTPITARDLDDVFERQDLRERIRERFEWTLNLDPRYRVIALVMALRSHGEPELAAEGMPARELWEQARSYWPDGFPADSRDEFDVLLEEMVNLEVLAETGGRFRLPSSSVLRLLGDADSILDGLARAVEADPPQRLEPDRARRQLPGGSGPSPLTFREESVLLGADGRRIRIVFGTPATRVELVRAALAAAAQDDQSISLRERETIKLSRLNRAIPPSRAHGRRVHVAVLEVDDLVRGGEILRRLAKRLSSERDGNDSEAVVLIVDESSLDSWADLYETLELELEGEVRWLVLKRWTAVQVQAWLDDFMPVDDEKCRRLIEMTGGWPVLLVSLIEAMQSGSTYEQLATDGAGDRQLSSLLDRLDLVTGPRRRLVETMAVLGEGDPVGLAAILDDPQLGPGDVSAALDVLALEQAVEHQRSGQYLLDAAVARAVGT